jgi:lysophospholipase L1-like esterase
VKKIIERFILVLSGLVVVITLSEITLRIIAPLPSKQPKIYNKHPILGWELIPNIEYYAFNDVLEYKTKVRINSWGLRDDEIDLSKDDKMIILTLGDSYTFAHEVEKEKTFVELLERRLSSTLHQDIEIINAGRQGYGTAQELLFYEELIERGLRPDVVFLVFSTNDILDNQCLDSFMRNLGIWPCFEIVDNTLKLVQLPRMSKTHNNKKISNRGGYRDWSLSRFIKDLRLYKLIYTKLFYLAINHPDIVVFLKSYGIHIKTPRMPDTVNGWYTDRSSYGWLLTKALLKRLKQRVEENGGRFVMILMPSTLQYSKGKQRLLKSFLNMPEVKKFLNDYNKPQRLLKAFCKANSIPVIDLLPGFEAAMHSRGATMSPFFFPYNGHLNPEGHRLVADLIYNYIMNNGDILGLEK